jgi:hypothetical protein
MTLVEQAVAKVLTALLPLSYLPLVRGRRLRKEAMLYAV